MKRFTPRLALGLSLLVAGCSGESSLEDELAGNDVGDDTVGESENSLRRFGRRRNRGGAGAGAAGAEAAGAGRGGAGAGAAGAGAAGSGNAPPVGGNAPPAGDCPSAPLSPGNHNLSLQHDGVARTYIVHVPNGVNGSEPVPLVIDLHGLTSSASAQASLSGWRRKSDQEGFIVVHPQGLDASWNGGDLCCGTSQRSGVDDEGFMRALVARMAEDTCIDAKRVYATGLSNGGAMSHLLACQTADLFAATAPVSMGNGTNPCTPSRPISVVMTRGTRDALVSFNGGLFPSAQEDFEQWATLNGCRGTPATANGLCQVFSDCNGGVEVKACAINAGHVLYNNSQNFSVPDVVWETFERQTLP